MNKMTYVRPMLRRENVVLEDGIASGSVVVANSSRAIEVEYDEEELGKTYDLNDEFWY